MANYPFLIDPTGAMNDEDVSSLSPRPVSLKGLSVGLLDNTKPNATILLNKLADLLTEEHGIARATLYTKDYFGTPAAEPLLEQVAAENDLVITAVGDCGSCSAATVADGILLERAGTPTVSIISDSFWMSGRAMAGVQGFPGFDFVAVRHPMASLSDAEIAERAREVLPEILRVLGVE